MKLASRLLFTTAITTAASMIGAGLVAAQDTSEGTDGNDKKQNASGEVIEEIIVMGSVIRSLDLMSRSDTGSRLGLSAFEIPATIDVIGNETMRARGLLSVTEAVESLVGVTSGENPAGPSAFSMRGFTDNQITSLRDGLRIGAANMVMRPQNTFNLERVEVLKGPASVLYGEGAIAGTINAVTKKPKLGQATSHELLATYGSFDTYQVGFGTSGSFSERAVYRLDASRTGSSGWVDRTPSNSMNITAMLLGALSDTFEASVSFDYLEDDLPNNWGQPLLPDSFVTEPIEGVVDTKDGRSIDQRMRFTNYNIEDDQSQSDALWLQFNFTWRPSDHLTVHDQAYYYTADRAWFNAEQYIFDPLSKQITRDRFFVSHDQEIFGNRFNVSHLHSIGNLENTFIVGFDYNEIDFVRIKGFPDGDAVDPLDPVPGLFGDILESKKATALIKTTAFYFEDSLEITPRLRLVTGGRYETIDLDRDDYTWSATIGGGVLDPSQSFELKFKPFSWRAGLVYKLTDEVATYAQFSTGKDPVGTELFSVEPNESFELASSRMWEVGVKASLNGGKTEITAAYYDIRREDLLTQIGQDEVVNLGSQISSGIEVAASTSITDNWRASFNIAYTDASYGEVFIPFLGDATGNTPTNVPEWTATAWTSVGNIFDLPLEIGGGIRYVDDRFADVSNIIVLKDYFVVSVYAAYSVGNMRFMVRSRNVTDEKYVPWVSPWYANQVALGAPRSYEFTIETKF